MHLNELPSFPIPCGLTVGSFDGVHLGHQMLIKHLKAVVKGHPVAILTFSNHPSYLFAPQSPTSLICTPEHKKLLLTKYGAEIVLMIPFSKEFSETPFEEFLSILKKKLRFSHLILGTGAAFGKDRQGNEGNVSQLSKTLDFHVEYLAKFQLGSLPVSSGRVRLAIETGDFQEVQMCLGRAYSLYGKIHREKGNLIMDLPGICLPPEGTYPIQIDATTGQARVDRKNTRLLLEIEIPENTDFKEVIF